MGAIAIMDFFFVATSITANQWASQLSSFSSPIFLKGSF
jgi:hypothetical protein